MLRNEMVAFTDPEENSRHYARPECQHENISSRWFLKDICQARIEGPVITLKAGGFERPGKMH